MRLFHRTTDPAAASILTHGFKDARGTYMTATLHRGVWLSNVPVTVNEGAKGDALLEVMLDLPEAALATYEWIGEEKLYREWLVPARLVNAHAQVRLLTDEEEDDLPAWPGPAWPGWPGIRATEPDHHATKRRRNSY
jgi:hypothetical protein